MGNGGKGGREMGRGEMGSAEGKWGLIFTFDIRWGSDQVVRYGEALAGGI
jgi:hypothetical protein